MAVATMRQLLEAGIHFGHQTRRWNPKMKRFIFGSRNGIYIIDLQKTLRQLNKAYAFVRDTAASGGTVLFVGTKKQAQEAIKREAERCGMFYVANHWLGGTLTNFVTIRRSIQRLHELDRMAEKGEMDMFSKKEESQLSREQDKLQRNLSGIKTMEHLPDVMFVIDAKKEAIAVREAARLGIPCVGIVDTNTDPDDVWLPVPGNDDAIRAINLFSRVMAEAVIEGKAVGQKVEMEKQKSEQAPAAPKEPSPAEEQQEAEEAAAEMVPPEPQVPQEEVAPEEADRNVQPIDAEEAIKAADEAPTLEQQRGE